MTLESTQSSCSWTSPGINISQVDGPMEHISPELIHLVIIIPARAVWSLPSKPGHIEAGAALKTDKEREVSKNHVGS